MHLFQNTVSMRHGPCCVQASIASRRAMRTEPELAFKPYQMRSGSVPIASAPAAKPVDPNWRPAADASTATATNCLNMMPPFRWGQRHRGLARAALTPVNGVPFANARLLMIAASDARTAEHAELVGGDDVGQSLRCNHL